ncbi:MAG: hypothetical protein AAFP77_28190 [Bacteroidota bacterium]
MFFTRCIPIVALLILSAPALLSSAEEDLRFLQLSFYDQEVELTYREGITYPHRIRIEELALRRLYNALERRPYTEFLRSAQALAEQLKLNDWLYAQLLNEALADLYGSDIRSPIVVYATYFLLAKSGYDVRITYRDQELYLNAYTSDVIYEIPVIEEGGRKYANISAPPGVGGNGRSMYLLNQRPNPQGRSFRFQLDEWPLLLADSRERYIAFQYRGRTYELPVRYQAGLAQLLASYPLVSEYWYLDAPLSPELERTLVPQLRRMMQGLGTREKLELLVAFTRSGFSYRDDKTAFGENKPMIPDELFFYPFSDCEDRSALFYALVKVLLDLPMIVIAYDDHLTVAVSAPGVSGDIVKYEDESFLFCDPTGPQESSEIGRIPSGYEKKSFEIIGHYRGGNR